MPFIYVVAAADVASAAVIVIANAGAIAAATRRLSSAFICLASQHTHSYILSKHDHVSFCIPSFSRLLSDYV